MGFFFVIKKANILPADKNKLKKETQGLAKPPGLILKTLWLKMSDPDRGD